MPEKHVDRNLSLSLSLSLSCLLACLRSVWVGGLGTSLSLSLSRLLAMGVWAWEPESLLPAQPCYKDPVIIQTKPGQSSNSCLSAKQDND